MGSKIAAAKDRVLAAGGSGEALGRLNMNAATQKLMATWAQYCGEEKKAGNQIDKHEPNAVDIINFLRSKFNVNIPAEQIAAITGEAVPNVETELKASDAADPSDAEGAKDVDLKAAAQAQIQKDMAAVEDAEEQAAQAEPEAAAEPEQAAEPEAAPEPEADRAPDFENDPVAANPNRQSRPRPSNLSPEEQALRDRLKNDLNGEVEKEKNNESVEQLDEAPAPVRQMFSKLALAMYRAGLITIERKGVTYGGTDAGGTKLKGGTGDEAMAASAAIDESGNYLNAKLLSKRLRDGEPPVAGADFTRIMSRIRGANPTQVISYFQNEAHPEDKKIMLKIAGDALLSISKTEQSLTAGENITSDGNTLDFGVFRQELVKYNFSSRIFEQLKTTLSATVKDGVLDDAEMEKLTSDAKAQETRAMIGLMAATILSVKAVQKPAEAPPEAQ